MLIARDTSLGRKSIRSNFEESGGLNLASLKKLAMVCCVASSNGPIDVLIEVGTGSSLLSMRVRSWFIGLNYSISSDTAYSSIVGNTDVGRFKFADLTCSVMVDRILIVESPVIDGWTVGTVSHIATETNGILLRYAFCLVAAFLRM